MVFKRIRNPRQLFLIDCLGALLTTCFLLGILRPLEHLFGMPAHILLLLAIPAAGFAIFSAYCFWFADARWRLLMRVIIVANLLYCCVTAGLIIWLFAQLTWLGVTYFVLEIGIICALVFVEKQALDPT